jgi:hypothetical protein
MKKIWESLNKINLITLFGIILSIINITIAIISKNLLYFIISFPIFFFFVYNTRKEFERVKRNEANKKT